MLFPSPQCPPLDHNTTPDPPSPASLLPSATLPLPLYPPQALAAYIYMLNIYIYIYIYIPKLRVSSVLFFANPFAKYFAPLLVIAFSLRSRWSKVLFCDSPSPMCPTDIISMLLILIIPYRRDLCSVITCISQ